MANTIKLKRGTSTPSTSDISNGEVAIDTSAKKLYVNDSGTVKEIGGSGSVGGASGLDFNDNVKVRFGTGNDLELFHDGSNSYIKDTGTGALRFFTNEFAVYNADGSEWLFKAAADGANLLKYDGTTKFETLSSGVKFTGELRGNDDERIKLGSSQDFQIYHHSSSDSFIVNDTGHLGVKSTEDIRLTSTGNELMVKAIVDGSVELYYDNVKKLETYGEGIKVYGSEGGNAIVSLIADEGDDNNDHYRLLAGDSDSLYIQNYTSGAWETHVKATGNGSVELYYDNSKKFETTSSGISVTGNIVATTDLLLNSADDQKIYLGASNDLKLFHDGSHSYVEDSGTGDLRLKGSTIRFRSTASESMIGAFENGAVEIYYDNSKKLETTSAGATITGDLTITDDLFVQDNVFLGDTDCLRFGDSEDLEIQHNGSNNVINYKTGNLIIKQGTHTDAESPQFDGNGNLYIPDSNQVYFGGSGDLALYHDGSDSYINDSGTGYLIVQTSGLRINNAANNEALIHADQNGNVELHYDNVKMLETYSNGVKLPQGANSHLWLTDNGKAMFGTGTDLSIFHDGTQSIINDSGDKLQIRSDLIQLMTASGKNEYYFQGTEDGAAELYYDNGRKLRTTSTGIAVEDHLDMDDDHKIRLGSGGDCEVFHDGTNTMIDNNTGDLKISSSGTLRLRGGAVALYNEAQTETMLYSAANSSVQLMYDNAEKFRTTSSGARMGDSSYLYFGAGEDMWMGHNGSHNYIKASGSGQYLYLQTASGNLILQAKAGEDSIWCGADSDVELYYDGSKKLETSSAGVNISGQMRCGSGFIEGNGEKALHIGSLDAGGAAIYFDGDSNGDWAGSDYSWIKHDTGGDMVIAADNPNNDANVVLRTANGTENSIICQANSSVELYFDTSKKFETTSTGGELTGRLAIGSTSQLVNESAITATSGGNTCCFRATGAGGHNPLMLWNSHTSGTRSQIQFADGSSYSSRGSITTNGSNVSYGGTSDYRLKQDDVLITDGLTKVNALKPKRFKWKDNLSIGICDGFFAHEVQEVAPTSGATIGAKDEVDSDGNPVYQSVDQSKLIPLLTAAIQELSAEINTLKTKVTALEAA